MAVVASEYEIAGGMIEVASERRLASYDPLAHPQLVFELGKLRDQRQALAFARTWGLMGGDSEREDLDWLLAHGRSVRLVLGLWARLQAGEDAEAYLRSQFPRSAADMPTPAGFGAIDLLPSRVDPVRTFVTSVVAANLDPLSYNLGVAGTDFRLELDAPSIVACYLHLSRALTGELAVRQCQDPDCGSWFAVSRKFSKFCPPPPPWSGHRTSRCGARYHARRRAKKGAVS